MKKLIFICLLAIIALSSRQTLKAKITLEHRYDSANYNLYIVNLEIEGQKYIWNDGLNYRTVLYNLDYSIFKIMTWPNITITQGPFILYVSEHFFNTDDSIEYMISYTHPAGLSHTIILNESGTIIFSADTMAPQVNLTAPQAQFPIYNTPNGTKMILSHTYSMYYFANIYSLPGRLPTYCCDSLMSTVPPGINNYNNGLNDYPNPSNGNTTLEFNLPQGAMTGEIVIYNNQGVELKRYDVDNTFHTLLLNNSEFHSGTYFYQLMTANGVSGAKKMMVIH
jgi:hypothetical protein